MTRQFLLCIWFCIYLGVSSIGNASLIDFETVPGDTPADQFAISTQYVAEFGVRFSLQDGGTPFLERTGANDSGHGFWNAALGTYDIEASALEGQLGDYFLRFGTTTFSNAPGPVLVIDYANAVSAASAQIWDIDAASGGANGYEAWTITARDINDAVIDTVVSPNGVDETLATSLNGKPWQWSFEHTSDDIYSIAIEYSGTATVVGLAFDNFSTASVLIDNDSDGISNELDNCIEVSNIDQRDTNGDGFGNICDPDLDNDGFVNFADVFILQATFFTADADSDFTGDGAVNFADLVIMKELFLRPPGPSGLAP